MKLEIEIENLDLSLNSNLIGSAAAAQLSVFIPLNPKKQSFKLKNKITLALSGAILKVSLGKIQQLEQVITENIEEGATDNLSTIQSNNTKFKIKILSGTLGLARWVTMPIPQISDKLSEKALDATEEILETLIINENQENVLNIEMRKDPDEELSILSSTSRAFESVEPPNKKMPSLQ